MLLAGKTNDEKSKANFAVCKIISKVFEIKAEIIPGKTSRQKKKILMPLKPAEKMGLMEGVF